MQMDTISGRLAAARGRSPSSASQWRDRLFSDNALEPESTRVPLTPEQGAREGVDGELEACGWTAQDFASVDIHAGRRLAGREYPLEWNQVAEIKSGFDAVRAGGPKLRLSSPGPCIRGPIARRPLPAAALPAPSAPPLHPVACNDRSHCHLTSPL